MAQEICPYTIYSLQFYSLLPVIKICQLVDMPKLLSYLIAMILPLRSTKLLVNFAAERGYVTLVPHQPRPDHDHSSGTTLKVTIRSVTLGVITCIGLSFINTSLQAHFIPLGFYLVLLTFFHFSEFFVTSITNPSSLSPKSFLLDHSVAYVAAIAASFIEYGLEVYLFPGFKKFNVMALIGLMFAVSGEIIRKLAMFTAGKNFSHAISETKDPNHKLVTTGVYRFFRHPAYAGWFYWAVGSQILLLNPFCIILFTVISCKFFEKRIDYEEQTLINFFGDDYIRYKKNVALWMPIRISSD